MLLGGAGLVATPCSGCIASKRSCQELVGQGLQALTCGDHLPLRQRDLVPGTHLYNISFGRRKQTLSQTFAVCVMCSSGRLELCHSLSSYPNALAVELLRSASRQKKRMLCCLFKGASSFEADRSMLPISNVCRNIWNSSFSAGISGHIWGNGLAHSCWATAM